MKENLDLNARLEQKLTQERELIQQQTSKNYSKLEQELKKITNTALVTIKKDMERQNQIVTVMIGRYWLIPALIVLIPLLGMFIGSWGLTRYLSGRVLESQKTLDSIDRQMKAQFRELRQQEETLKLLKEQTGGIAITQTDNGTFLILPPDSTLTPGWECQGKPCQKLE